MDEQRIKDQYRAFYRAAIAKDKDGMESALDNTFHLTHMTGMQQSREQIYPVYPVRNTKLLL